MSAQSLDLAPDGIRFVPTSGRLIRVEKLVGGEQASRLHIVPFTIRIGKAHVRVDGIADVFTQEQHRMRGYASELLHAAVDRMQRGKAAISVLYGIHDFYHRFGYATAGADALIHLVALDRRPPQMPPGWRVEPLQPRHLRALRRMYEQQSATIVGAAVRRGGDGWAGKAWRALDEAAAAADGAECRVLVGSRGRLGGYAWRSRQAWFVNHSLEKQYPNALVIGEAMADSSEAADAVLAACRQWAREAKTDNAAIEQVTLCNLLTGYLADAAMRDDSMLWRTPNRCGGFMARTMGLRRLLTALEPELTVRTRAAGLRAEAAMRLETEMGAACLAVEGGEVRCKPAAAVVDAPVVHVGPADLARLAFGGFPPEDVLARLPQPPSAAAAELLCALFPLRQPFIYPAERP